MGHTGMNAVALDTLTLGYVECLFFVAPEDEDGNRAGAEHSFEDLDLEDQLLVCNDCEQFQRENSTLLERALRRNDDSGEQYSERRAGHDFAYSRNGHGTGFWDRIAGPLGEQLHKRAKAFGEQNLYQDGDVFGIE
jgi:hypothetical protein